MAGTTLLGGIYSARRMAVEPEVGAPQATWTLTQDAFDRLLAAVSEARDAGARRYIELRRNLVRLFEWRG